MIAQPAGLFRVFSLAITMLAIAACASNSTTTSSSPSVGKGQRAAMIALDQVGAPYRYGGATPQGFDCRGLVQYSYSRAGVTVPRTTGQLWTTSMTVGREDLRAGDILFFSIDGKMSHVGMYLGERRFVHAPQSGSNVSVGSLESPFYKAALIRAGRPY
jgi:cell wall-associated NlpC family hydrolase